MNHYYTSTSNTDDVASATWPNPGAMGDYPQYPNFSVPQSTYPDLVSGPGYTSLAPTTEMGAFANLSTQTDITNQNIPDLWSMPGPSHFYATSAVPQPQQFGIPDWAGVDPLADYSATATPYSGVSPSPTTPTSQDEWVSVSEVMRSLCTTPASSPGYGGEVEWFAPEQGANVPDFTSSPVMTTFLPAAALGKRRREAERLPSDEGLAGTDTRGMPPPKRARGGETARGILNVAQSAAKTRHKPAARIPNMRISSKPKEAGRGAERLATPSSQGIYHRSMPGPSSRQGWAVGAADGRPTWVEGSVDEKVVHHTDSTVQEQNEEATVLLYIPRKFKPEDRRLLQTSNVDDARGAVQEIRCRICPDAKLKDFEEFKRHCRTSEAHPREIHFCDRCGDFFARIDSLHRHRKVPPNECKNATPARAAQKRWETEDEHRRFLPAMDQALRAGQGIGKVFSQIIKEKFPESSKKRTGGSK